MATATTNPLELYRTVRTYELQSGVTLPQAAAVEVLRTHGGLLSIKDLRAHLGAAASTMTVMLDAMERNGLVVRERSTEDRRVILIRLAS